MIPVGYMAKKIAAKLEWVTATNVVDIYSVSDCISNYFADYINFWEHNGYWLFDNPDIVRRLAEAKSFDLAGLKFFYYEVYEKQYNENEKIWSDFEPEASFRTAVRLPKTKQLEGYDVVTFWSQTNPECSPLSCNNLAEHITVNAHCLLPTFDEAKAHLEAGLFDGSEPDLIGFLRSIRSPKSPD
jgi:hypothetical protein